MPSELKNNVVFLHKFNCILSGLWILREKLERRIDSWC